MPILVCTHIRLFAFADSFRLMTYAWVALDGMKETTALHFFFSISNIWYVFKLKTLSFIGDDEKKNRVAKVDNGIV